MGEAIVCGQCLVSILGEIQAVLTGRQGGKLRDHTGPIHDRPA